MKNRSARSVFSISLLITFLSLHLVEAEGYPSFSIMGDSITEGNSGQTQAQFTVTLSAPSTETLAVRYETIQLPGSSRPDDYQNQSATAGTDFVHANGTLTFIPGETNKTITVSVIGDEVHEYDEGFVVRLIRASSAPIEVESVRAVIENDDVLQISINDVTVTEGDNGTSVANFVISLSRKSDQYLVGSWFTANSTARADVDHRGGGGSIQYMTQPGESEMTLPITILGDKEIEDNETFLVNLSVLWGTDVQVEGPGTCTILNDDFLLQTEEGTDQEMMFRLEGALGATHVIEYSTNMTDWIPVSTNQLYPERVIRFATEKRKQGFYRAALQQ